VIRRLDDRPEAWGFPNAGGFRLPDVGDQIANLFLEGASGYVVLDVNGEGVVEFGILGDPEPVGRLWMSRTCNGLWLSMTPARVHVKGYRLDLVAERACSDCGKGVARWRLEVGRPVLDEAATK